MNISNQEQEPVQPNPEDQAFMQDVQELGLIYGIRGLRVKVKPGAGWFCERSIDGSLTINVDPVQTVEGYQGEGQRSAEPETVSPEITSLFIIAHELGHAKDFLDSKWTAPKDRSPANIFFVNLVDDIVIDTQSRRVPLLDAHADAIYSLQMPSDLVNLPRHVQLMYGIRIGAVVNSPCIAIDPEIAEIISELREHRVDNKTFNIIDVMTNPHTSLSERRQLADRYIRPHYDALLAQDRQELNNEIAEGDVGLDIFQHIYDEYELTIHPRHNKDEHSTQSSPQEQDSESHEPKDISLSEQLTNALKEISDELHQEQQKLKDELLERLSESDGDDREERNEALAKLAGSIATEMRLDQGDASLYANSLDKHRQVIEEVAEIFMELASPTDENLSPRFRRNAHLQGARLHPRKMSGVALQIETDQEQTIWQPIERRSHRQDVTFNGLDIHLLVDVSGSMAGEKSQCAADSALCLIEGLQLARHKVSRSSGQFHQPDVRTQIIAFGSDTNTLSPLSPEPTDQQKGQVYTNLLRAESYGTLICGALDHVQQSSSREPGRNSITIIISDGHFGDFADAVSTLETMPENAYIAHVNIGGEAQEFISNNHEAVSNPNTLPMKLHSLLLEYIRKLES